MLAAATLRGCCCSWLLRPPPAGPALGTAAAPLQPLVMVMVMASR
jgi:hypothetical protein